MHIHLFFLLIAIITIITLICAGSNRNVALLLFLALISITGIGMSVVFPLAATRVEDSDTIVSEENYELLQISRDGEMYYAFQNEDVLQFVYNSEKEGLQLGEADLCKIVVTYQENAHLVIVKKTTSTHHNQWLFLKDSAVTENSYDWHFFFPRNAVWYPY